MLNGQHIKTILEDLLRAELANARAGDVAGVPPGPWSDDLTIDGDGLGSDSLERLRLAGAVNEMFHIHETGIEDSLLVERRFGDWVDLVARCWQSNPARLSFRTSGSTGKPKRCTHSFASLHAEVQEHATRLRPRRIFSAVPAHHIYGFLFTVLLPAEVGCPVLDIRRNLPPVDAFRPGDVIVAFPDHWHFMLRSLDHLPDVTGVTSTAPMPTDLACDLSANGLRRLVEIYGASETAGIAWRDDPHGPFQLLDHWAVADTVEIGGAARPLPLIGRDGRQVTTPDEVVLLTLRSFTVRRRADGAVQIGGVNVFPKHVAETLAQHPMIAQARVRPSQLDEGGRLKALIVPRDITAPVDELRRTVQDWMATHLTAAERPRSLTFAVCLPKGALGKDSDWSECE
jgi:4-coumarate--CoA ligase (photoactive yellow protein activation family)